MRGGEGWVEEKGGGQVDVGWRLDGAEGGRESQVRCLFTLIPFSFLSCSMVDRGLQTTVKGEGGEVGLKEDKERKRKCEICEL